MSDKTLHIVSFQIPTPPDYGGVMDVYYRLLTLKELGIRVILHSFYYNDRKPDKTLENIVSSVYYYKRNTSIKKQFSTIPYIVKSRECDNLIKDLCRDNHPILFEGIHTCCFLNDPRLDGRKKIVRMHNVEHHYYKGLAKVSNSLKDRLFFKLEAIKLKHYEPILINASAIMAITDADTGYFKTHYPTVPAYTMSASHPEPNNLDYRIKSTGNYHLYHGNFSVPENIRIAQYIAKEIAPYTTLPFYIVGHNASNIDFGGDNRNITIMDNVSTEELQDLIIKAKSNVLLTFQPTGLKLKLLNALNWGGFCVVNSNMISGTTVKPTCIVKEDSNSIIESLNMLASKSWDSEDEKIRQVQIAPISNRAAIKPLIDLL